MTFKTIFSPTAVEHLDGMRPRDRATILDQIEVQLTNEPNVRTRNRKPLRPNALAGWELRVGEFRVFYDVNFSSSHVEIVAVGIKPQDRLFIAGEEYSL